MTIPSFDWEHADTMPTVPGRAKIWSPFAVGENQQFPADFINDKSSSDGWILLYNTFSKTENYSPKFFILYNRFRAFMRGFFYVEPGTPIYSSYVTHSLSFKNGTSPSTFLNSSTEAIINLKENQNEASLVQQYKMTSTGTWYAAEFDINYDPNIVNIAGESNLLQWGVDVENITNYQFNGTSTGTITGTLAQPKAPSSNFFGQLLGGGISAMTSAGTSALSTILKAYNIPLVSNFADAILGGISSFYKNAINGSLQTTTDSTVSYINLKMSLNHTFTGQSTNTAGILNPSLYLPGSILPANGAGIMPYSINILGLFTLSNVPTADIIDLHRPDTYDPRNPDDPYSEVTYQFEWGYPDSYLLRQNSYSILFNPAIFNTSPTGAHYANLKQEIISSDGIEVTNSVTSTSNFGSLYGTDFGGPSGYGQPSSAYYGPDNYLYYDGQNYVKGAYLRVSLDVIPNNGSKIIHVIKTYDMLGVFSYHY